EHLLDRRAAEPRCFRRPTAALRQSDLHPRHPSRRFGGDAPRSQAEWSGADPARLLLGRRLAPFPAIRVPTRLSPGRPQFDLDGSRAPITSGIHLDCAGPVAKGVARDRVRKEILMLPLVLSSDSHVFEPP